MDRTHSAQRARLRGLFSPSTPGGNLLHFRFMKEEFLYQF